MESPDCPQCHYPDAVHIGTVEASGEPLASHVFGPMTMDAFTCTSCAVIFAVAVERV